jgi:undecaprenyl-diphosphatase
VTARLPAAVRRRLDPEERYGLRATLFCAAVTLVAVPFGLLLDQVVRGGPLLRLDRGLANAWHQWALRQGSWLIRGVRSVSLLGGPPFLTLLVVLTAGYALWRGRRRLAAFLAVTAIGGSVIDTVVKNAVHRPRPNLPHPIAHAFGKSFPSGHAMSSTVVYGALLLVLLPALPRARRPYAFGGVVLLVLAVGASRLALGVHYLTDVLGGIVLGLAWLAASVAAFRIWRVERGRAPAPVTEGVEPEAARDLRARA